MNACCWNITGLFLQHSAGHQLNNISNQNPSFQSTWCHFSAPWFLHFSTSWVAGPCFLVRGVAFWHYLFHEDPFWLTDFCQFWAAWTANNDFEVKQTWFIFFNLLHLVPWLTTASPQRDCLGFLKTARRQTPVCFGVIFIMSQNKALQKHHCVVPHTGDAAFKLLFSLRWSLL